MSSGFAIDPVAGRIVVNGVAFDLSSELGSDLFDAVTQFGVSMIRSKATWNHHVVVPGASQAFRISVINTTGQRQFVVIRIMGDNGFDYLSSNFATITVGAGTGEQDLTLGVDVSAFVGRTISFTISMTWGPVTGTENASSVTKSGKFNVVAGL